MARKSVTIYDTTGTVRTPLDEIPDEVKTFVEEVYEKQRKRPARERVEYANEQEMKDDYKLIADYCAQRPAGVLACRKSPTKDLPAHVMDLRIKADLEANGARNAGNDRREPANAGTNAKGASK